MGRFLLLIAIGAVGCSDSEATMAIPEQPETALEVTGPGEDMPPPIYGEDRRLLPSDEVLHGLTLPRGLTLHTETEGRNTYLSVSGVERLKQYFGPRLDTGQVEPLGLGTVYRSAAPRQPTGEPSRMDIVILPHDAERTRIEFRVIAEAGENPRPEREIRNRADREATYWQ